MPMNPYSGEKPTLKLAGVSQDLPYPDQPGQSAGQAHRDDPDSARINARGARGRFALADGAKLESQDRSPEEHPDQERREECQRQRQAHGRTAEDARTDGSDSPAPIGRVSGFCESGFLSR